MADSAAVDDDGHRRFSRRTLLAGGGLLVLASGCRHSSAPRLAGPDDAALTAARESERALVAAYDALAAAGRLTGFVALCRDAHARHLAALGGDPPATPTPTSSNGAGAGDATRTTALELASADVLRAAAVAASSGETAALFASIAASHTAMSSFRQVGAS
jgi:hypothetical protein